MDSLGTFNIDDYVCFPVIGHDTSGSTADLDSGSISLTFFENDLATSATLTAMSTPDQSFNLKVGSIPGFYNAKVQLSSGNGFEANKQYIAVAYGGTFDSQTPGTIFSLNTRTRKIYARKGEQFTIVLPMYNSSDVLQSGLTITSTISKTDHGSAAGNYLSTTNSAAEIQTSGTYYLTLTATEMDADVIIVQFADAAASAKSSIIEIWTQAT